MKSIEIEPSKTATQNYPGHQAGACESETARKIEQSIAYMLRHLDEPLQVATLAAQANISASHFFALFKRQTGCAPIDCFIRLRMQHACRLLDETMLSVKEIAATLGYDDPFYFSRIFKSVNQVAPSEYRSLKNRAKEAVGNSGTARRSFHPCEPQPGRGCAGLYSAQNQAGAGSRLGTNVMPASGFRNAGKY
jgi:AraC-like DNA-binding protein